MKCFFLWMLVSCGQLVAAQSKPVFHSQNYIGLLEGQGSTSAQLLSINGFQYRTWFGGIGTGLDYYYFRSVPLFLSINKSFCSCERSLFVSADAGYHWVWDKQTGNQFNAYRSNGDFSPAIYWSTGLGYRIGLKNKKDAILLNAGFSAKHVREELKSVFVCLVPPCPDYVERLRYKLNRLSLRVGWQF